MFPTPSQCPAPDLRRVSSLGQGLAWLRVIVNYRRIAGLSSVILVMLLGQPRIFYTMFQGWIASARVQPGSSEVPQPWVAQI